MQDDLNLLYPLNEFYAEAGLSLPEVRRVDEAAVPEPYKSLLVHENDMTHTLESFCNQSIHIQPLKTHLNGKVYSRQVVLALHGDERPVEFGAIKIYLENFPWQARQLVLGEKQPLGGILHSQGMEYASRPKAFIQVWADVFINTALRLKGSNLLYGRKNVLLDSSQRTLAEIIEILPPSQSLSGLSHGSTSSETSNRPSKESPNSPQMPEP
jgi:chorismate-pyruvate lyase